MVIVGDYFKNIYIYRHPIFRQLRQFNGGHVGPKWTKCIGWLLFGMPSRSRAVLTLQFLPGYPHSWMVDFMENTWAYQQKMDDDWEYPYFRKPPYTHTSSWRMTPFYSWMLDATFLCSPGFLVIHLHICQLASQEVASCGSALQSPVSSEMGCNMM